MHPLTEMYDRNGGEIWSDKWRGSVTKLTKSSTENVWKVAGDFLGLNKWAVQVEICNHIEGELNKPGCVRYCSGQNMGKKISKTDNQMPWVKEKLLTMDPAGYSYSYTVIDGNLGLDGYFASLRLHHMPQGNCAVEWSWEANPSNNCAEEQFVPMMSTSLEKMIERLDEVASS
eukprot:Gb_02241 [translate_table: standard]